MGTAQVFYIQAMRRGEASFVVPFSYATLIFAAAYDLTLFDIMPDALSAVGAGVILAGGLLLAWREGRQRRAKATKSAGALDGTANGAWSQTSAYPAHSART